MYARYFLNIFHVADATKRVLRNGVATVAPSRRVRCVVGTFARPPRDHATH